MAKTGYSFMFMDGWMAMSLSILSSLFRLDLLITNNPFDCQDDRDHEQALFYDLNMLAFMSFHMFKYHDFKFNIYSHLNSKI